MLFTQALSMHGILETEADKKPMITCDNCSYSVQCMSQLRRTSFSACTHSSSRYCCKFPFDSRTLWPQGWPHFTTLQQQQKGIPHNSLRHRQERSEKECSDVPMFWHTHCSEPPPPSLVNQSWAFVLQELGRFTEIHASQKSLHSVTTPAGQEALTEIKLSTLPSHWCKENGQTQSFHWVDITSHMVYGCVCTDRQ